MTPRHRLVPIFPSCRDAAELGRQKLPPGTAQHPLFPAAKPLFGGRFAFSPLLKPFLTRRGGQPRWGAQPGGSPPPPGGMLEARRGENRRAASRTQTDGGLGRKGGGGQPESTEEGSTKWGERRGLLASPGQSGASPAAAPPPLPKLGQGPTPGGVGRGGRPRLDVRRRVYKGGGRRGDPQRRSRAAAEPPALPRRLLPAPAPPARCCRAASTAPWPCSPSPWPSAPSRPPPRTLGSGSSCRNPWLPPPGSR